jgi:hypothetical protein
MSMSNASLSLIVSMFDTYVSKFNVFMFMFLCDVSILVSMLDVYYMFTFMFGVLILVLDVYFVFMFMSNVYFVFAFMSNALILVLDVYYVFVYTFNVDSMFTTMFVFDIFNMYLICITLECMCLLFATFMSFESILFLLVSLCLMNMTCNSFILSPTLCLLRLVAFGVSNVKYDGNLYFLGM